MKHPLYLGRTPLRTNQQSVQGRQITLEGESFYQIANFDRMRPFFMTVVSDADHWLFISSNGGLTAGRRDASLALFPYYTDDKIRDMAEVTGSKTLLRVRRRGRDYLWEPLSARGKGIYRLQRNLYKNFWGNQLIFEEVNNDLALTFRYAWLNSQQFGFVRRAWLVNSGATAARVELLDGVQNLMPCGVGSQFNLEYSTLLDAYKKSELLPDTGLGLFRLSAIPVDRPEPAEALRTTVAWSVGLKRRVTLLSSAQVHLFRQGQPLRPEMDVRAERGAYFIQSELQLGPGRSADWLLVADVNQDQPTLRSSTNGFANLPNCGGSFCATSSAGPRDCSASSRAPMASSNRSVVRLRAALQQHAVQYHARRRLRQRLRGGSV